MEVGMLQGAEVMGLVHSFLTRTLSSYILPTCSAFLSLSDGPKP